MIRLWGYQLWVQFDHPVGWLEKLGTRSKWKKVRGARPWRMHLTTVPFSLSPFLSTVGWATLFHHRLPMMLCLTPGSKQRRQLPCTESLWNGEAALISPPFHCRIRYVFTVKQGGLTSLPFLKCCCGHTANTGLGTLKSKSGYWMHMKFTFWGLGI